MTERNGTAVAWIPDGYTRSAYIQGQEGYHPPLRFSYRPCLVDDRAVISAEINKLDQRDQREAIKVGARAIHKYLLEWDLKDVNGKAIEPTVSNILRLEPNLYFKLRNVVLAMRPSDSDPEETGELERSGDDPLSDLFAPDPESDEAADAKNSAAG